MDNESTTPGQDGPLGPQHEGRLGDATPGRPTGPRPGPADRPTAAPGPADQPTAAAGQRPDPPQQDPSQQHQPAGDPGIQGRPTPPHPSGQDQPHLSADGTLRHGPHTGSIGYRPGWMAGGPAPFHPGVHHDQAGPYHHATHPGSTPPRPGWATPPPGATAATGQPVPAALQATADDTATVRTRTGFGRRTLVAAVALAALVGAGTGVGGYALSAADSPTAAVRVSGGNAPAAAPLDGTVSAAAERISPSTVTIEVRSGSGGGLGTGIIVNTQGDVLTNQHVVDGAGTGASIQVSLDDGRTAAATVVGQSTTTDLAVIRLDPDDVDVASLTPATFAESGSVTVGQSVVAVGAPLGLSKTVTSGVVSNVARPVRSGLTGEAVYQAVQTDAAINPGNSGGPLVDLDGRVVGINSSIASTTESSQSQEQAGNIGIGFAIPADVASRVSGDIIADGSAADASLGVGISGPQSGQGQSQQGQGQQVAPEDGVQGATVQTVADGGAAASAGLQAGDVITRVDDVPTPDADALIAAIRYWAPGTTVTVTYQRDGESQTTRATLGSA